MFIITVRTLLVKYWFCTIFIRSIAHALYLFTTTLLIYNEKRKKQWKKLDAKEN